MKWLALLLLLVTPASAAEMLPGLVREPIRLDVSPPGGPATLEAEVTRPDRAGRFPLVLLVHGTPRGTGAELAAAMARSSPAGLRTAALAFARRGYAAVAIMRRGFGQSSGRNEENSTGTCTARLYTGATRRSGEDVVAAIAALRTMPFVLSDKILLLGQSTGGFAVTAAAALNPAGVVGVLDFAGGRGSSAPDTVCHPDGLARTMGELGRSARVPALWIYAENDHFFAPTLARRMLEAYNVAGAPGNLHIAPPYGTDGHSLVSGAAPETWFPTVAPFLAGLKLPTDIVIPLPPLPTMVAPPQMKGANCRRLFADYATVRSEAKAFAVNPSGACGRQTNARDQAEARNAALRSCAEFGSGCITYAVGQAVVQE